MRRPRLWTALLLAAALLAPSCTLLDEPPRAADFIGPGPRQADAPDAPPIAAIAPDGPLELTVEQAIVLALTRNQALVVQRIEPSIERTVEQELRALFDPQISASASWLHERETLTGGSRESSGEWLVGGGLSQRLPTGTTWALDATSQLLTSNARDDRYQTRLGASINQALLRGAGTDVNLAVIRQARLDTLISQYELRGFAQALAAEVETTYWQYALARRTIEIVVNAMELAQQQVSETQKRIEAGGMARTELAAAEAELARRRENLINARSAEATLRLRLLQLLNPTDAAFWDRAIVVASAPSVEAIALESLDAYVQAALRLRPELNQARLAVRRDELELVRTRNGLLPRLDLFVALGKSSYANSFGRSLDLTGQDYDVLVGASFDYPLGNRAAEARHRRAVYTRRQALAALENLEQLAQVDVRSAYIEIQRALAQVTATAATRALQEESLRAETEKNRVGRSTSLLVAQAQRDLLESQIAEVRAVVNALQALIDLQRQSGILLQRRGIEAPGGERAD